MTNHRRGALDRAMLRRCQAVMRKACADFAAELREFNRQTDHVHLHIDYPPKTSVPALVESLKGVSARRLRAEFTGSVNRANPHRHFWSPSYLAASCGEAPPSSIRHYIEQQQHPA
jgi:putative transposase